MEANNLQSYFVKLHMGIKGTDIKSEAHCIDLKDPEYRFHTSPNAYCPPGTASIWGNQQQQQQQQAQAQPQQQVAQQQAQPQVAPLSQANVIHEIMQEKTPLRNPQASASYRATRSRSAGRRARG